MKFLLPLLFLALWAHPATFHENLQSQCLRITSNHPEQARAIARFAVLCANAVDKALDVDATPEEAIAICLDTELSHVKRAAQTVVFTEHSPIHSFTDDLMRALIKRRCKELGKDCGDSWFVCFLASALTFQRNTTFRTAADTVPWDYAPAKLMFASRTFPNVCQLCSHTAPMASPWLYQLNAMYSNLLFQCIEYRSDKQLKLMRGLLDMAAEGRSAEEALNFVVGGALPPGMSIQAWFENTAPLEVRKDRGADSTRSIEQKVKELESIDIVSAGNVEKLLIDDLPKALSDMKVDTRAVQRRQTQFLALRNEAPPLLRPSLDLFAHAMGMLADQKISQFQKEIKQARSDFATALARQQLVEQTLREKEKELIPVAKRLAPSMEIIARHNAFLQDTFVW